MEVFWAKGFDHTSLADLTAAMGIAAPSLYAAFGDKEALFCEATALYQQTVGQEIWDSLENEATVRGAIGAFLSATARAYAQSDRPAGCMIVLGAPADPVGGVPGETLRRLRAENVRRLRRRFERAVREGELGPDFDCEAAAVFYATLQNGMSTLARDGAGAAALDAVARTGVQSLAALAPRREPSRD
jgi:AcrR family transcriptional regulator